MKRFFTIKFVFIVFTFVFAANVLFISHEQRCIAFASHTLPVDYCLQMDIPVTNNGTSNLTNYPVRVLVNEQNLISSNYLDGRGWDLLPVIGSINNEINNLQQDITTSNAVWWFIVPDLPAGETRVVRSYMGNNDIRRDQGFYFSGNESIRVPNNAALQITDNLEIDYTLTNSSNTARTEILLDKLNTSTSYSATFLNIASTLYVRFSIDGAACDLLWNSNWTNTRTKITFSYIAAAGVDTFIYVNDSLENSCDLDQGAIGITTQSLYIGSESASSAFLNETIVHDVYIREAGIDAIHLGFDPDSMNETVATNPFEGTVQDYSGNGLTGTYTRTTPQTNISYSVGIPELVDLADFPVSSDDANSIVGPGVPDTFLTPIAGVSSGPLYDLVISPLQDTASAAGVPAQGLIAAVAWSVGLLLGIITWRFTGGFLPAVIMSLGIPIVIVVTLGWVPQWWLITWGLAIIVTWLAASRSRQPA